MFCFNFESSLYAVCFGWFCPFSPDMRIVLTSKMWKRPWDLTIIHYQKRLSHRVLPLLQSLTSRHKNKAHSVPWLHNVSIHLIIKQAKQRAIYEPSTLTSLNSGSDTAKQALVVIIKHLEHECVSCIHILYRIFLSVWMSVSLHWWANRFYFCSPS